MDWSGPARVALHDINSSNRQNWVATHDPEKVNFFVKQLLEEGHLKPLILTDSGDGKLDIADGHHRFLAYESAGIDPVAYVGLVPSKSGPWEEMHAAQARGPSKSDDSGAKFDAWAQAIRGGTY